MGRERGSATVLLLAFLGMLLSLVCVVAAVTGVAAARAQVSAAADLAALAAAGTGDCGRARRVAHDNGAELQSCVPDGADVVVMASREIRLLPGHTARVSATARAGPPQQSTG